MIVNERGARVYPRTSLVYCFAQTNLAYTCKPKHRGIKYARFRFDTYVKRKGQYKFGNIRQPFDRPVVRYGIAFLRKPLWQK